MTVPSILKRPGKPDLAYVYTPGKSPVMFLGGYRSDMSGTKAMYLESRCAERGQGFLRFDYSGHGLSGGNFMDGTIGSWKQDALDVLNHAIKGPVILVGSSMGGWISLLIALERNDLRGVVGIAAAPDFTGIVETRMTKEMHSRMQEQGFIEEPNDYGDPYVFTRDFIEESKQHFLMGRKHKLSAPLRLIQGGQDSEVDVQTAYEIEKKFSGDVGVTIIPDGEHRLSRPQDLEIIDAAVQSLS